MSLKPQKATHGTRPDGLVLKSIKVSTNGSTNGLHKAGKNGLLTKPGGAAMKLEEEYEIAARAIGPAEESLIHVLDGLKASDRERLGSLIQRLDLEVKAEGKNLLKDLERLANNFYEKGRVDELERMRQVLLEQNRDFLKQRVAARKGLQLR